MSPKNNNKQVSAAVRILQQKRDASARATHLMVKNDSLITYERAISDQAGAGKCPKSTFLERKIMSTKTSFKRIALVAASALALGGFSVISAPQASAAAATATPFGVSAATYAPADSFAATVAVQQVAGALNFVEFASGIDGASAVHVAKVTGGTFSSVTNGSGLDAGVANLANTEIVYPAGNLYTNSSTLNSFRVLTPTAGTITVVIATRATASGVVTDTTLQTFTITVGPKVADVYSAANSTVLASGDGTDQGAATPDATKDAAALATPPTILASSAATVEALKIVVDQEDANDTDLSTAVKNEVTITGVGAVGITAGAPLGSYATETAQGSDFYIFADGRAGTASVAVSVNGALVKTYKVIFAGVVASYDAVQELVVSGNGTATTDAILVSAKDSAGNAVSGALIYAYSADTTIAAVETSDTTEATAIATSGTIPTSYVAATPIGSVGFTVTGVAGKSGTVKITLGNAATLATSTITKEITVKVGAVAATTVKLSLDKAAYAPGEKVTATLSFLDASGNAVAAGPGTGVLAESLTVTNASGATAFATAVPTKLGTATATFYAPLLSGTFTVSGTTGTNATYLVTAAQGVALTAQAEIEGDPTASLALDAANAATDAANNAYDEAQNATQAASDALAAVTALAAQVKSLIASVKKLTAAVAKLKK